jgi:hypothetical protein
MIFARIWKLVLIIDWNEGRVCLVVLRVVLNRELSWSWKMVMVVSTCFGTGRLWVRARTFGLGRRWFRGDERGENGGVMQMII